MGRERVSGVERGVRGGEERRGSDTSSPGGEERRAALPLMPHSGCLNNSVSLFSSIKLLLGTRPGRLTLFLLLLLLLFLVLLSLPLLHNTLLQTQNHSY